MPLRSLRTRLVALFLVSLAIAAFLFAAVAVRQFTQEERSRARARAEWSVAEDGEADRGVRREAAAWRGGRAARLRDPAWGHHRRARATSSGSSGLSPPIDEVRFAQGAGGHRGSASTGSVWDARAETQTLNLKLADGTSTIASAAGFRYRRSADRRDRRRPAGALDQHVDARAGPPRRACRCCLPSAAAALVALLLSRRITRPVRELTEASEPHRTRRLRRAPRPRRARTSSASSRLRFEQMARQLKEASEHERNFLMRISHELRTPLTAIQGHVQAIADGVIDGEDERQASLEIVLAEAGRLAAADRRPARSGPARDAHVLAQCRGGRPRRLSASVRSARSARRRRGAWRRVASARRGEARRARRRRPHPADRHEPRRERAARDACRRRDHGRRDRRPGRRSGDRERHGPRDSREADRVAILRPFVTSSVRHGIGLGLPVSSELAQAMSGTLVVGDRAGGGAALTLSLPLAPGSGDSPSAVPASGLVAE